MKNLSIPFIGLLCCLILRNDAIGQNPKASARPIHQLNDALTRTMTPDGVDPPLASRFYLYPNVLFHEVLCVTSGKERTYESFLLRKLWLPDVKDSLSAEYTALYAFQKLAEKMVYRPKLFLELSAPALVRYESQLDERVKSNSRKYVSTILDSTLKWMTADGYEELRSLPEYTPLEEVWSWEPTPPNYIDALQPNWDKMKSLVLIDTSGLITAPRVEFDSLPHSDFHNAATRVYDIVNQASDKQIEIAKHWDCNPLQTHAEGHFMYSSKQMTPGGHWMGIAGVASTEKGLNLFETSRVYTNVAMALYEGFIISWRTKYRYHLIRPETYINRYIDPNWRPLLETPPFPEYTSAHSVISMASAMVLTAHFGDMAFKDTLEVQYRLPVRKFSSFTAAAKEVSESRVYGGIHYQFGVNDGMSQGALIANRIIGRFRITQYE